MSVKKITITGGAGFIGSNLCEFFSKEGFEVTCLDNLSTGFKRNIEPLLTLPNFHFVEGDIRDLETCRRVVAGCDVVLHEAALGSVPRSINDPINTNANNVDGFLNMLVAARDAGVKRFVYAASSSTYGDSATLPKKGACNRKAPFAIRHHKVRERAIRKRFLESVRLGDRRPALFQRLRTAAGPQRCLRSGDTPMGEGSDGA